MTEPATLSTQLDDYLQRRAEERVFSGAVLVAQGGTILLDRGYGWADVAQAKPNTPATRFQLASVAKTLTATAIMQLVERGDLGLDTRIAPYIADVPPAWQAITVEQLLAHTAGVPGYFEYPEFKNVYDLTPDGIIAVAKTYPLVFPPGSAFEYSDTGYVLLGTLIERVSGQEYVEYLREHVFAPLGMDTIGLEEDPEASAVGYAAYGERARVFPVTNVLGDGDLLATTADLHKFDRGLYGDRILSAAAREKMFTGIGDHHYGLGWEVEERDGKRVISHSGWLDGFSTDLMRFPDDNVAIVVLSNLQTVDATKVASELAGIVLG